MAEAIDRKLIPSIREGIDVVRMIFFKNLKDYLKKKFPEDGDVYAGMLAGAIMNDLFGTPNPQEKFRIFAEDNSNRIREELENVPRELENLCILLTDALRMHFLCNHQEGIEGNGEEFLKKARDYGILIESRDVPFPKGFMELVYRVGKANGLIVEQKA
ncbi:MAG: hypothetical protein KKC76_12160 [Proteobacteria bacterium]|nr:hypothetical protein [Pseudomonadota bacterium]MBU4295294.1 hypothetical protein [Pseudomonadota bacterium]MCG2748147.1 hypothetical protein [Desulfobulbaceae bacterium]